MKSSRTNRTLLAALCALGVALAPARGGAQGDGQAAAGATPARSALDPGFDVLLPDPEPAGDTKAGGAETDTASNVDLDIADRVLSAAKQVTTVQEAPSIVTVIRADEIVSRGYRNISQVLETIPGWQSNISIGNHLPFPMVRGTAQAALLLRDGVSMFDPVLNGQQFTRVLPLETVKSIEVVTGPGGVLWGANSFLGIVNVLSKDADDINGIEVGAGYGDGDGAPQDFRAWVLFGKSFKFRRGPKLGIVQHVSYENYLSPRFTGLRTVYRSFAPSPPGLQIYTTEAETNPERAYILNIDGKISYGPVTLSYAAPIAQLNNSLSFGNNVASGPADPRTGLPTGAPTLNAINIFDRYVTLQFKTRFLKDRLGLDAKLYGIQFVRAVQAITTPGTIGLPSGSSLVTDPDLTAYRVGFSIDGDAQLPGRNRLLYGGDVFHEWVPGVNATFPGVDPAKLPLACPLKPGSTYAAPQYIEGCPLPFIFDASRTVVALYISDQWKPISRLTLDGGLRYQVGLGQRGYQGAPIGGNGMLLGSASLVWNFFRDMNLKANYANGFRPPVFNNTDSNGGAVQFGGNRNLVNEQSQAAQAEWNARLLKNFGVIRQLQVRLDYAYTQLDSLIVLAAGSYTNRRSDCRSTDKSLCDTSRRFIHSVEAAAKLYAGEHTMTLGYTFLHINTNDKGILRSIPQHQFSMGWVISAIPGWLDLNGTLLVLSSYDDPNRVRSVTLPAAQGGFTVATFSDVTFDRLPPQAVLNLGARAKFLKNRLWTSINFFNVLNQKYYYPDPFYDLAPTLEVSPTPAPGWSFFFQIGGKPW